MRWQLDGRKVKLRDARGRRRELLLLLLLCLLQEHGRHSEVIASHTRRLGCLLCLRYRRLLLLLYLLQLLHLPQLLLLAFPFFLLACFSRELVEEVLPLQGATLPGGGQLGRMIIIFLQRPAEFAEVVESTTNTTTATAEEAVLRRVRYARHGPRFLESSVLSSQEGRRQAKGKGKGKGD